MSHLHQGSVTTPWILIRCFHFRLQGMTMTHCKVPTHRRRFEDLVKTLEAYSKDTDRSSSFRKELPNKGMSSSLRNDSLKSSSSIRKEGSNRFLPSRSVVDVTEASSREISPPTEDEAVWAFIPGNCHCWISVLQMNRMSGSRLEIPSAETRLQTSCQRSSPNAKISKPFTSGTDWKFGTVFRHGKICAQPSRQLLMWYFYFLHPDFSSLRYPQWHRHQMSPPTMSLWKSYLFPLWEASGIEQPPNQPLPFLQTKLLWPQSLSSSGIPS